MILSTKGIPEIQLPSITLPLPCTSFCRPAKSHMKYRRYITPTWYLKKKRRFSPKEGRVSCSPSPPDLTVTFCPFIRPQYSYCLICSGSVLYILGKTVMNRLSYLYQESNTAHHYQPFYFSPEYCFPQL